MSSSRLLPAPRTASAAAAAHTRFPALGHRVRVTFDPADPKRAMIEDDVRHARKICLLVLAIFTPMLIIVVLGIALLEL